MRTPPHTVARGCAALLLAALTSLAAAAAAAPSDALLQLHERAVNHPHDLRAFDRFVAVWAATDDDDALTEFLTARAADGGDDDRILLALHHARQGDADATNAAWARISAKARTGAAAVAIADLLFGAGENDAAAAFLEAYKPPAPDYRVAYLLGAIRSTSGDLTAAVPHFLDVLEINVEPNGPALRTGRMSEVEVTRMFDADLPPSVSLLMVESRLMTDALEPQSGRANTGSGRVLPQSVPQAHAMAVTHLRVIRNSIDKEKSDEIEKRMRDAGYELADLILDAPAGARILNAETIEDHLESATAQTTLALSQPLQRQLGASKTDTLLSVAAADLTRNFETAALAARLTRLNLALTESGDQWDPDARWRELDLHIDQMTPAPFDIIVLGKDFYRGRQGQGGPLEHHSQEQKRRVAHVLADWTANLDMDISTESPFYIVVTALLETDDYEKLAACVAALIERHRRPDAEQTPRRYGQMLRAYRDGITPFTLPADSLDGVPFEATAFLMSMLDDLTFSIDDIDAERMAAALADADAPPITRAIVALGARDEAAFNAIVDPLLQADDPDADILAVAAAWATQNENHVHAIALLDRAGDRPMSDRLARRIDEAIVGSALKAAPTPDVLAAARRAFDRLEARGLDAVEREQLNDAKDTLFAGDDAP